jgi:transposase
VNDVSRYTDFCQFRSAIRSSDRHLIVGIDIAKDKHRAFFGTARGKTLWRRLIFTNDLIGYNRLIEQARVLLSQHQLEHDSRFEIQGQGSKFKVLAVEIQG